jgi:hypothetical protein
MPEWLYAVLVGVVIVGLVGVIWRMHATRDDERNDDVWDAIGRDTDSGLRGKVHRHDNRLSRFAARLWRLEEKSGLKPWEDDE